VIRPRCLVVAVVMIGMLAYAAGCDSRSGATPDSTAVMPTPGEHQLAIEWGGQQRTYQLHAPPAFRPDDHLPLVVVLHGYGGNASEIRTVTGLDTLADRHGFLVAYPDGISGNWNSLDCCGDTDDVGFIQAMVDHLVTVWGADLDRLYATGYSQGAELTYRLAVELPGVFSAIAPVSAGFSLNGVARRDSYRPASPVSIVTFYGTSDTYSQAVASGLAVWGDRVGCAKTPPPESIDTTATVSKTMTTCTNGTDVVAYAVQGMGHTWPGSKGYQTAVDADAVMWDFFAAHPRTPK
jgi:polyhydroxybutyrate depolymerase